MCINVYIYLCVFSHQKFINDTAVKIPIPKWTTASIEIFASICHAAEQVFFKPTRQLKHNHSFGELWMLNNKEYINVGDLLTQTDATKSHVYSKCIHILKHFSRFNKYDR